MTPKTYVLVGAGGTGSILFPLLVRYLDAFHGNRNEPFLVAVIDGDHVETHNLERQMFLGNYVDENKATALAEQLNHPHVRPIPEFLGDENLEHRIRDGDVVLIAADNYDVRRRLEHHAHTLENLVIINGGNEKSDGSLQLFVRIGGINVTPPLSWQHPEILAPSPFDPSSLNCATRAQIPGGEQTIIANAMSAAWMLNALSQYHGWLHQHIADPVDGITPLAWHELHFDLNTGRARPAEWRIEGWRDYVPETVPA